MTFRISRCGAVEADDFTQTCRQVCPGSSRWGNVNDAALWPRTAFGTDQGVFDINATITVGIARIVYAGDREVAGEFDDIDVNLIDHAVCIGVTFHRHLGRGGSGRQHQRDNANNR